MEDRDVVVVGAGPAGSTTAETLARAGCKVTVFEKSRVPGQNNVCAGMFGKASAQDFEVEPSLFEKIVYKGIHFFDFAAIEVEKPEGFVMILRDRFDKYLADRAVSRGAELKTQTRVTDVNVLKTGLVEIRFKTDQGSIECIRSRAVVLADGPHTLSSRLFPGLGFQKSAENLSFAYSCDVEARGNTMEHFEMYYDHKLADWGYGWIFPKKDMLNFGFVCRVTEYEKDKALLKKRLEYLWKEHPRASKILKDRLLIRKRGAMIPQRAADKVVADSILVVGDAAGMADALLGGGIDNAMYTGKWAADVLEEGLKTDRLDSAYLERYQTRWASSTQYKTVRSAEKLRDFSCKLDRIRPGLANRLKYLFGLRVQMKAAGKGGLSNDLRLIVSPSFRRSMELDPQAIPWDY